MINTFGILLIFLLGFNSVAFSDSKFDLNMMLFNLEHEGEPYFRQLVSTGQIEVFFDEIEKGNVAAIRASAIAAEFSDASVSLALRFSLSRAIVYSPDAVMALIPEVFSVSDLCTIPYIEASREVESDHVRNALTALESVGYISDAHAGCIRIYKAIPVE